MKKSKEYKISIVFFIVTLVLEGISLVTGLMPNLNFSIDKICMYLGFVFLGLGLLFLKKAKNNDNDDNDDK